MSTMKAMDNIKNPNEIENPSRFVALSATFSALVFIATAIFALAIVSSNGYFNFGESMVYLSSLVGGPLVGMIAGAFGSALSDIITGYGSYAPGTFFIKGIEGYVAGYLFLKLRHLDRNQVKRVYVFFSVFFVVLSIALTTDSLWSFVGNLVNGKISLGSFPFDIGSYNFSLLVNLYTPQINPFDINKLQNFIVWNPTYYQTDIPGISLIILSLLFIALLWFLYFKYGEKSKIIISCAVSGSLMVIGYFLYETVLLQLTPAQAFGELPFNVLQVIVGIVISLPIYTFLSNAGIISNSDEN